MLYSRYGGPGLYVLTRSMYKTLMSCMWQGKCTPEVEVSYTRLKQCTRDLQGRCLHSRYKQTVLRLLCRKKKGKGNGVIWEDKQGKL
jgi:hypothetical protein